jgi:type II secretory pathway pseudopilin PulG
MASRGLFRNQHGDTLVEVTIALSILAAVLTSGFLTANRAYMIGQNARERTEIINLAQAQAEQLKNFRDTHTWNEFLGGITTTSSCPTGVSSCFHMALDSATGKWVPAGGSTPAISSNGSITITNPVIGPLGKFADFEIVYVLNPRGGGVPETNRIPVELANLDGIFQ